MEKILPSESQERLLAGLFSKTPDVFRNFRGYQFLREMSIMQNTIRKPPVRCIIN